MRVALVYDWLYTRHGGGEDTFLAIAKLYPEADIHCLVYKKESFEKYLHGRRIFTSRLQKFPRIMKNKPSLLLPFIKRAVTNFDFSHYDLVISISSAWVKNIHCPKDTFHVSYIYSPARMIWDSWPQYLDEQRIGPFKLGPITKFLITKKVSQLRLWDYYQSQSIDHIIAISHHIARRVEKFYHQTASVIYPPVRGYLPSKVKGDYYVIVSTLSQYKNIDLAIKTFKKMPDKQLLIAGDGPDMKRLTDLLGKNTNITLLGRVSETKKSELLSQAKAFLFMSIEDFGIAPLEALSCGTPVIALRGGGLSETIQEDVSGVFFNKTTVESLTQAISKFEQLKFNNQTLVAASHKYSEERFAKQFSEEVNKYYRGKNA